MEISSIFRIAAITQCKRQQEETPRKYADLCNVARDIFSIIPHSVGVGDSFSLGQDVLSWRHWWTTGETLHENVLVQQFAWAINEILAAADTELDTTNTENDSEIKTEAEERKLHRMAKVHDCLGMWEGSQNLGTTQNNTRP